MSPQDSEAQQPPDVDELARSMLILYGPHDDDHDHSGDPGDADGRWAKAQTFAENPERAAAVTEASQRDRERYLNSGLAPVECRFCHATVNVKKIGPGYTAVQWNSGALAQCAVFAELRTQGGGSSRSRSCPKLTDSINHAVAEGYLEETCTAPPPGDG